ncbi:MAG: hypothetical protein IJA35_03850 [Clostridia bacterium]|nr:hypothetical protein [Clostridia bacterium]
MSYDDLSVRINNGDKAALREFLSDVGREIYDIAMAELKDRDKAMEVVRVVFSRINDSAKSGDCPSELSSWIVRLTLEQCLIAQDTLKDMGSIIEEDAPIEQKRESIEAKCAYEKVSQESDADVTLDVLTDETVSFGESKKRKDERKILREKKPKKAWDIIVIMILSILTLFMAWTVLVMLITGRFISDITQGIAYDYAAWFNENIFKLF